MRRNLWISLAVIVIFTALAVFIDMPKSFFFGDKIKALLGLDLQGGTELIYEADLSASENKTKDLDNLKSVFRSRIDELGVAEPTIQTIGTSRILIELPGIKNIDEAVERIGDTYELVFMTETESEDGVVLTDYYSDEVYQTLWAPTDLTGRSLSSAEATFQGGQAQIQSKPVVSISFDNIGQEKFATLTRENLDKRVAMVLDNKIISAPYVKVEITDGRAVIEGSDDIKEAQQLAKRLNEGALPVTANLVAQQNIGASLGADSLKKSAIAGAIGLLLLVIFMIVYYRFTGIMAAITLTIYALITLAMYKLIPVTLSLAGIAGFVLSIGMAVDANVLIFERIREELRYGKEMNMAVKDGFVRAWSSIRDSNLSSIITCFVLYIFGSGPVRGFALTLAIGILVSMFTAITATRTFMLLIANTKAGKWFNV